MRYIFSRKGSLNYDLLWGYTTQIYTTRPFTFFFVSTPDQCTSTKRQEWSYQTKLRAKAIQSHWLVGKDFCSTDSLRCTKYTFCCHCFPRIDSSQADHQLAVIGWGTLASTLESRLLCANLQESSLLNRKVTGERCPYSTQKATVNPKSLAQFVRHRST